MIFKESEPTFQLRFGEYRTELTQDVVGVISATMDSTKFSPERLGVEERFVSESHGCERREVDQR